MLYIIMCGGNYKKFEKPKQLLKVCGEVIVERTIRLLRENGITDIAISTNNPAFDYIDVPKLRDKDNQFEYWGKEETKKSKKSWLRAYYPVEEPVCYIHGDVYFSDEAIKTIVNTKVKDTMFICGYDKQDGWKHPLSTGGREPFGYKIVNYEHFNKAVKELLQMVDDGKFVGFPPCSWNVYRYINGLDIGLNANGYGDLNNIFKTKGNYIVINDYTNDVDDIKDVKKIEYAMNYIEGGNMVRVEALEDFYLKDFWKLVNIERKEKNEDGKLFKGDTFECDKEMFEYLTKTNHLKRAFVKLIEVIPEVKEELPTNQTGEEVTQTEETKEIVEEAVQEVIEEQDREYVKPKKKKRK